MRRIPKFDSEIYSEEIAPVTSEREYDEVVAAIAAEDEGWRGYAEWAVSLEATERAAALDQFTFERKQECMGIVKTARGAMLIKRDCNHKNCRSSRCDREIRLQGVAI